MQQAPRARGTLTSVIWVYWRLFTCVKSTHYLHGSLTTSVTVPWGTLGKNSDSRAPCQTYWI